MGRHSLSYLAAQQEDSTAASTGRGASAHVGRIGLLAVALGIGAAVAGGTAVAHADTSASAASDSADSSSSDSPATKRTSTRPSDAADRDTTSSPSSRSTSADDDDPTSPPSSSLDGVRRNNSESAAEPIEDVQEVEEAAPLVAIDPEPPTPEDEAVTEYGDIGKWMLEPSGDIADFGGVPYDGRTVLEAVNVVIVDPTSRSSLEATWRLNAAMRRAGFPARMIHSTGFRGLIDGELYRQQPRGLLVGYSDDFFLLPNNHGRIFGPDPVETSSGYVWSGSFSTEGWAVYKGLPRHAYVSSNAARDALASDLVASGRATLSGTVSLDNSYNTATTTTGDHDGYAVVITLQNLRTARVATAAADGSPSCLAAGFAALSRCDTKVVGAAR